MDTPKRDVSWLESFPPDIWAYFAIYLPGEQLGRLMMTGATLLRQRLKSPTVVKSIKLGTDVVSFPSFPRFLNELPFLEDLVISSHSVVWSDNLSLKIGAIPSGVRKLELIGFWHHYASHLFVEGGATLKLDRYLPHLETLSLPIKFASNLWMTQTPKTLTRLCLDSWDGTVALPSSLIHFETAQLFLSEESFVAKLPVLLVSFIVTQQATSVDLVVAHLPPSTCKLSIGYLATCSPTLRDPSKLLEGLPKSLTWFSVPAITNIDFASHLQVMLLLPSTLTQLTIVPEFPCSAWYLLPPHLTALELHSPTALCTEDPEFSGAGGLHHKVTPIPFHSLPRSMTSLKLFSIEDSFFCSPPIGINQSYFPPNLTDLTLPDAQLSPKVAQLLPSSLQILRLANLCERVCEHLPVGLKTLRSDGTLMSPNLIKFLPRSLTSLQLYMVHSRSPWFDYNTGELFDSISKLTEYSVHQNCLASSFKWGSDSLLPRTLIYLEIVHAKELGDSFLIPQQVSNLLELKLNHCEHFSDISIPLLPSHLSVLDLGSSSMVSGKSFRFLPRCLTCLDLSKSESIFDSDIQHLPRTLKRADLSRAIHLTDLCVPDFPRRLEVLSLRRNATITPSSIPHFPYPLLSSGAYCCLDLQNWNVYQGAIKYANQQGIFSPNRILTS